MKTNFDVAVIGGGIIGSSVAYHLAKENMNIVLFEGDKIGSKASGAAAGMLGAHSEADDLELFYPFARESQQAYHQIQAEVESLTGLDFGMKTGGIYKLAYSETEKQELSGALALETVKWANADEVKQVLPGVASDIIGAAYIEDDVNIMPAQAALAMCKAVQALGGTIFENTSVVELKRSGSGYEVKTTKGAFTADKVVVANGVWSSSLFKDAGLSHELFPIKGEILSLSSDQVTLKHTIFHNGSYIVPRRDGSLVVGSTMTAHDWSDYPTVSNIEKIIAKAKTMFPAVANMSINQAWAGLRPQTFDTLPFIGQHPGQNGIFFATGHSRNGILLAPVTGMMIRDLMLGRDVNQKWIDAFKVERGNPVLM